MIRLNIHETKTHLSRYLKRIQRGEVILLCRRNLPVAEIRPLPPSFSGPRRLGTARGQFTVPPQFFEPLPKELLKAFGEPAE